MNQKETEIWNSTVTSARYNKEVGKASMITHADNIIAADDEIKELQKYADTQHPSGKKYADTQHPSGNVVVLDLMVKDRNYQIAVNADLVCEVLRDPNDNAVMIGYGGKSGSATTLTGEAARLFWEFFTREAKKLD